jgi:hypothetical protein
MLLDMRVVADPNCLFYAGDTAQTIARGIGFRFAGAAVTTADESEKANNLVERIAA